MTVLSIYSSHHLRPKHDLLCRALKTKLFSDENCMYMVRSFDARTVWISIEHDKSPKFKQFGIDRTIELNSLDGGIGIRGC